MCIRLYIRHKISDAKTEIVLLIQKLNDKLFAMKIVCSIHRVPTLLLLDLLKHVSTYVGCC